MQPSQKGSPFAVFVKRKPPSNTGNIPMRTPAERNVRPAVGVHPHDAPDPIRQGDVPSRWAHVPIVVYRFDEPYQEDYFIAPDLVFSYADHAPRGRMTPLTPRTNIRVPPHVAYGSLFTADPPMYGLG